MKRRRWARALCAAFVVLHLTAMLLRGAAPGVREPVWPLFAWYGDALRMTNTWGMFSKPPDDTQVFVLGIDAGGRRKELASTWAGSRTLENRVRDVRLRKVQTKLADAGSRKEWGKAYLRYFCGTQSSPRTWQRIELELLPPPPDGKTTAERVPVLSVVCENHGPQPLEAL